MKLNLTVFTACFLILSLAHATDDSALTERARTRQYLGGPDESDLKVQAQVLKLQKSKNDTNVDNEEGF